MTRVRRTTSHESDPRVARPQSDGLTRLARVVGRLLLWGCVLLLLIRGALSMLGTPEPHVGTATRGVTVTVTQSAHTETSQARRK
jgi:hypothetical protein